jgi:hypothetical protein
MAEDRRFVGKTVECPKGHRIKLEMLSDTPHKTRAVECPTCQSVLHILAGDIRGVVPLEDSD